MKPLAAAAFASLLLVCGSFCPVASTFSQEEVPESVKERMRGKSYPEGCRIGWGELRYLTVPHYDLKGRLLVGELVCNKAIAADLLEIFKALCAAKYPIEQMRLIDDFGADDESSMRANNTSSFCYRAVSGTTVLSKHSRGLAVDINPLYNPCVKLKTGRVQPYMAKQYADRFKQFPCKITTSDLAYRLFTKRGFKWGGAWRTVKDYQHFEKP